MVVVHQDLLVQFLTLWHLEPGVHMRTVKCERLNLCAECRAGFKLGGLRPQRQHEPARGGL